MTSLPKHAGGHSDLLVGSLTERDEALSLRLKYTARMLGHSVSGEDCFLVSRGIATMPLRLAHSAATAALVMDRLGGRPEVLRVLHPSRPAPARAVVALVPHRAVGCLERPVRVLDEAAAGVRGPLHEGVAERVRAVVVEARAVRVPTGVDQGKAVHVEVDPRPRGERLPDEAGVDQLDPLLESERAALGEVEGGHRAPLVPRAEGPGRRTAPDQRARLAPARVPGLSAMKRRCGVPSATSSRAPDRARRTRPSAVGRLWMKP